MIKKIITPVLFCILSMFSMMGHTTVYINNLNDKIKTKPTPSITQQTEKSPLSGFFDFANNYMFRGISQTNNLPTFQGILTYNFLTTGIYFGLWASNVNFPDIHGQMVNLELDTIVGVYNTIGDHFTYNIDIERYIYPNAAGENYNELIAYATYYFLTGLIGYSNSVYDTGKSGTYYNLGIQYDIPPKYIFNLTNINISGGFGHYSLPRRHHLRSYNDYNLQLAKTIGNVNLALQWTDTNGRSSDPTSLSDNHIVGKVTLNF